MKKSILLIAALLVVLAITLVACGSKNDGMVTDNNNAETNSVPNGVSNADNGLGAAAEDIGDGVGGAVTGAGDIVGDVVTGAGDIVGEVVTGAGDAVSDAVR